MIRVLVNLVKKRENNHDSKATNADIFRDKTIDDKFKYFLNYDKQN